MRSVGNIIYCLVLCFSLLSPAAAESGFLMRRWTTEDGLPQNTILSILQTRDGYLWVGTYFGLARFDGVRFKVFSRGHTPEFMDDAIPALATDSEGALWLGMAGGLVRHRDGVFRRVAAGEGLPGEKVWSLLADGTGRLWVGMGHGLAYRSPGSKNLFERIQAFPHAEIRALQSDQDSILVGTQSAVLRWDPRLSQFESLVENHGAPWGAVLPRDRAGSVWAANRFGLHRLRGNSVNTFLPRDGGSRDVVDLIFEDSQGTIWANLTQSGLHLRRGEGFERLPLEVPNSRARCMFEDREGSLWVGTEGGLIRLRRRLFESWTKADGLPDDQVWAVASAGTNSVWLGTASGVSRISQGRVEKLSAERRPVFTVKAVLEDAAGCLWAAETGYGVYRHFAGRFDEHFGVERLAGGNFNAVYQGPDGRLWIASNGGVDVFQRGEWTRLTQADGLPVNDVRAVLQGKDGTVWLGTKGGGLVEWGKHGMKTHSQPTGLSNNRVWALHEDANGGLWAGTEHGLNFIRSGRVHALHLEHGLQEELINQVLEDEFGHLWLSGLQGIYRVKRADLEAVAEGKLRRATSLAFGVTDGMVNSETNGENQPAGCRTPDGRLWFPTIQGVVSVDPGMVGDAASSPPVVIEQVVANGRILCGDDAGLASPKGEALGIGPGQAQVLTFHFTANSLLSAEKNRFRFRLEGLEPDWRDAGTTRLATYTNLKPGRYRFLVQACGSRGVWNETGAALAITIASHIHETLWFRAGLLLAVVGLIIGIHAYRLRIQHRFAEQERRHALELERARIARDLHDGLGAGLSQMAMLGHLPAEELAQPEAAGKRLQDLREQTRAALRSLNEVVWATNAKHDTLTGLVDYLSRYAEDFLRAAGIACRLDIPIELPAMVLPGAVRQDVFLAFKEALNNVARHSRATQATLAVEFRGQAVLISLTDNGMGFDLAEAASRPRTDGGNGLPNLKTRIEGVGGMLQVRSQPGQGTRITVTLPGTCHPNC